MKKDRLNILFVSPYLPHPTAGAAGALIVYHELRMLSRRHNVSLLSMISQGEERFIPDITPYCTQIKTEKFIRLYDATAVEKLSLVVDRGYKLASSLLSSTPYLVRKYWSSRFAKTLAEWTSKESFDIVQLEFTQLAQYGRYAKARAVLLDEHDASFVPRFREYQQERSPVMKLYRRMEWLKCLKHEITVGETFDHIFTLTDNDRHALLAFNPNLKVSAIQTGIDLDTVHPIEVEEEKDSLVFMGSFSHRPNVDTVGYFREKIYPLIKRQKRNIKIYILGKNEEFLPKLPDDFVVTGFCDDVAPIVSKCGVFIAPITWGGGVKVKILHAMALGRAVVTTPVGAEGLDVKHGVHLYIDSDPEHFAKHVMELLDDPELRHRMGRAGLEKVRERYSWETVIDHMEELYYSILSS